MWLLNWFKKPFSTFWSLLLSQYFQKSDQRPGEDHIHALGALKEATRDGDVSDQRRAHVEGQIRTDEGVSTAVYTDGSKNNQGNTSCSFYMPSHDLRRSYRMTDGSSVLAAEMEAIGRR